MVRKDRAQRPLRRMTAAVVHPMSSRPEQFHRQGRHPVHSNSACALFYTIKGGFLGKRRSFGGPRRQLPPRLDLLALARDCHWHQMTGRALDN